MRVLVAIAPQTYREAASLALVIALVGVLVSVAAFFG